MNDSAIPVVRLRDLADNSLRTLLQRYGMQLCEVPDQEAIPGSHWGDSEAGLISNQLYARDDTPVHSILHEACHYVCMDQPRRQHLHTDAGGGYAEEDAVCYLQILLADQVGGFGRQKSFRDMDRWGYRFRLGSAQAWFEQDAGDTARWLQAMQIIDARQIPTWRLRV